MLSTILSTFGIIFLVELPDKTALAALTLATRYRSRDVIVGTFLAFLVQTVIAVLAGSLLTFLPNKPIHIAAGLGFLVFAILALRHNDDDETEKVKAEGFKLSRVNIVRKLPWLASFIIVFLAEWGDLSQLATATLVARTGQPLAVGIGSLAGEWTVALLAVVLGLQVMRFINPFALKILSAILFAAVGIFMLVTALV